MLACVTYLTARKERPLLFTGKWMVSRGVELASTFPPGAQLLPSQRLGSPTLLQVISLSLSSDMLIYLPGLPLCL